MLSFFRKLVPRSKFFSTTFGEVVSEHPKIPGQFSKAYISLRGERELNGNRYLVGFKFRPDAWHGNDSEMHNYINLNIEDAIQLRKHLDLCINECDMLTKHAYQSK